MRQSLNIQKIHCYAERKGHVWQAFSIEFGLAAQGESFRDARKKLEHMVGSYLFDALQGEDRAHQKELLARRAPLYQQLKYFYYWLRMQLSARMKLPALHKNIARAFIEPAGKFQQTCAA